MVSWYTLLPRFSGTGINWRWLWVSICCGACARLRWGWGFMARVDVTLTSVLQTIFKQIYYWYLLRTILLPLIICMDRYLFYVNYMDLIFNIQRFIRFLRVHWPIEAQEVLGLQVVWVIGVAGVTRCPSPEKQGKDEKCEVLWYFVMLDALKSPRCMGFSKVCQFGQLSRQFQFSLRNYDKLPRLYLWTWSDRSTESSMFGGHRCPLQLSWSQARLASIRWYVIRKRWSNEPVLTMNTNMRNNFNIYSNHSGRQPSPDSLGSTAWFKPILLHKLYHSESTLPEFQSLKVIQSVLQSVYTAVLLFVYWLQVISVFQVHLPLGQS